MTEVEPREVLVTAAGEVLASSVEQLEAESVKVRVLERGTTSREAAEAAADIPVVVIGGTRFGADEIARLRATGLLIRAGVGYDVIDVEAATAAGIWVANVPDFCVEEVADHTILLLLASMRRLPEAMQLWRSAQSWHVTTQLPPIHRIRGKRLGLVGLGRIGRLVASRAVSLGWEVVGYDPYVSADTQRAAGAEPVELDELFMTSDALSLHCPLTSENHHLVDAQRLARTRPGAVIVNTSRGGLIDLAALDDAIVSGVISVAALDVLDGEPTPDLSHPLLGRDNVIVTSHLAWYSLDAINELATKTAAEALRYLNGERPLHILNPDAR